MKTYIEMADEVFRIGDEQIKAEKTKKKKTVIALSLSLVCVTAVAVGAWLSSNGRMTAVKPSENDSAIVVPTEGSTEIGTRENETTEKGQSSEYKDHKIEKSQVYQQTKENEFDSVGGGNWFCIPAFPSGNKIDYVGEKLTDEEARVYFLENKNSIVSALSSSGVSADRIQIKEKGYSHISYTGKKNENLTVTQNFRDYLVYNGNELIAIITLVKENGKIYDTPSFGGAWYSDFNKLLNSHKGEELVFVYVNQVEIVVAPDGTYKSPLGIDSSGYFDGIENVYDRLYCPEAVYVP